MSSPFAIIVTAWNFYKKQPVLNEITFWMFFVPVACVDIAKGMLQIDETALDAITYLIALPLGVAMLYVIFWGQACVLTVAKRSITSSGGRNRSSFSAVRKEAQKYIGPLALTEILRGIITLLWTLLFIVPGILYSIRTVFYDIIMIEEGKINYGRPALNRSKDLVTGKTWDIFWRVLIIALCVFLPAAIFDTSLMNALTLIDARLETFATVLADIADSFAGVFFIVCIVTLYSELKLWHSSM